MIRRPPRSTLFPYRRSSDLTLRRLRRPAEHRGHAGALRLAGERAADRAEAEEDRKSTRLNSSHLVISYAVFCLKKKKLNLLASKSCEAGALDQPLPCNINARPLPLDRVTVSMHYLLFIAALHDFSFFFFNDTATTEIYTLSLQTLFRSHAPPAPATSRAPWARRRASPGGRASRRSRRGRGRSEEHTSELQSPCNLVCRLLLEKKKTQPPR